MEKSLVGVLGTRCADAWNSSLVWEENVGTGVRGGYAVVVVSLRLLSEKSDIFVAMASDTRRYYNIKLIKLFIFYPASRDVL